MENICEWDKCKEVGKFKAPAERDNSKNFRWLCEEHIKLFNNNWNYFDGMSQNEIEKNIIAEYYQRCFGDDLPESSINIKI